MNTATPPPQKPSNPSPNAQDTWRVALFYQDNLARERAIALTDHLTRRFMAEVDFQFSWWCMQHFGDPSVAETAALSALEAEVLVFAAPALGKPDEAVRGWFERWVPHRNEALGVMVPLLYPSTVEALSDSIWMVEIEELARQTKMDCLLPSELQASPLFSESTRRLQQQTKHMGWVMDGILHQPGHVPPPPHWGLNE